MKHSLVFSTLLVSQLFIHLVESIYGPYLGCFNKNDATSLQYTSQDLNLDDCSYQCRDRNNHKYFALMASGGSLSCYCFSDKTWDDAGTASECTKRCPRATTLVCGGDNQWSVYYICPLHQWGLWYCQSSCHCADNEPCISKSGHCTNGCKTGWMGTTCNECAAGFWSTDCKPCHCADGAICDYYGYCRNGCEAEWIGYPGETCQQPACQTVGKFGPSCTEDCHCRDGRSCRKSDGYCYTGCATSWTGHATGCVYKSCNYNNGDCGTEATCESSSSMTWCRCPVGLRHAPQLKICLDTNECTEYPGICKHKLNSNCENIRASYRCNCDPGYYETANVQCSDNNECSDGSHTCQVAKNEQCNNTIGSFHCVCPVGYSRDAQDNCSDVDECGTGRHRCNITTERCENSQGSYSCVCRDGYSQEGHICIEINECLEFNGGCSHSCNNTVGSYKCSCPENYVLTHGYNCTVLESSAVLAGAVGGGVSVLVLLGAGAAVLIILLIRRRKNKFDKEVGFHDNLAMTKRGHTTPDIITTTEVHTESDDKRLPSPNIYENGNIFSITTQSAKPPPLNNERETDSTHTNGDLTKPVSPIYSLPMKLPKPETKKTMIAGKPEPKKATVSGPSIRLPVEEIDAHVTSLHTIKDGFDKEYRTILNEDRFSCKVGKRSKLKEKNKFKNIQPYDHNRLLIPGEQDYINASYIETYCKDDKYVAAQGPQKATVDDFWKMVWQLNCSVVVMLTNPKESGKVKCEEYWPVEGSQMYGDLKVTCTSQHRRPDYTRRHLTVTQGGKEHRLTQLHFSTWPDHGVPSRPAPLLGMLYAARRAASARPAHTVLVHCSAGVGRTGTYLSIDQLLKMAAAEGAIDVPRCVNQLRDSRMKMVQTKTQYEFVYAAVQEGVALGDTQLAADQFTGPSLLAGLLQQAEKHYQYLEKTRPVFTETQLSVGLSNASLNRDPAIVAADHCRVILRPPDGYINAVHVCPAVRGGPIAAQVPLPGDTVALWRLVHSLPGISIVSMETIDTLNQLCPDLIPAEDVVGPEGVRARHQGQHSLWHEYTLTFSQKEQQAEPVYANTPAEGAEREEEVAPPVAADARLLVPTDDVTAAVVVQAVQRVRTWTRNTSDSHVIVLCRDGASGCGQYVAASLLLDMLQTDRYVDVYSTVSALRHYRPQFVPSLDAYLELYEIVQEYVRDYETYQNV